MAEVAYKRVSTVDQNTARQLDGMAFSKVFEDKISGKDTNRPQLQAMLDYVREGDTVHVHSLDRLGRNTADLLQLVEQLKSKGVTVHFHKEDMIFSADRNNPMHQLMFTMLSGFAQFERELIRERQREGIAIARAENKYLGRKKTIDNDAIRTAMAKPDSSYRKVAKELGISLSTVQRAMKS
jgi:DNA invertase Pin-like site-specific DNA recombinase